MPGVRVGVLEPRLKMTWMGKWSVRLKQLKADAYAWQGEPLPTYVA
jgi:hypothetical protein